MRFTLEYPSEIPTAAAGFMDPDVLTRVSHQAEECGFDAIALSDHPAPSEKWRSNGGHDTFEPAVALSFMAAVTTRIRLMTHLYVLPFRNPYLAAKALTTLDLLSNGRLIAAVGAGYLRSEFSALGVEFDHRAALLDDALEALVKIWSDPATPVEGADFAGTGTMHLDSPIQAPRPPIWIGGNSKAARRRVVSYGQGWCPIIAPAMMTTAIRTESIDTAERFGQVLQKLHAELEAAGRDPEAVDIQVEVPRIDLGDAAAIRRTMEGLEELEDLGANWAIVHADADSVEAATAYLAAFAETVIRPPSERAAAKH